jgi:HEAT repeat protein
MYILWAVALAILLAAGVFCWLVVVPVWRVHAAARHFCIKSSTDREYEALPNVSAEELVTELGGKRAASEKVELYLRMPAWLCDRQDDATWMLAHCGEFGVPVAVRALSHTDSSVRRNAAILLGDAVSRAGGVVPALVRALTDECDSVRARAASALGWVVPQDQVDDVVPALTRALSDRSEYVRADAANSLGQLRPRAAAVVPELARGLRDKSYVVRGAAAWALGRFGAEAADAVPGLADTLRDEHALVRCMGAMSLGRLKGEGADDRLKALLKDPDRRVQVWAAFALTRTGAVDCTATLEATLRDPDNKLAAAQALAEVGGPGGRSALPILISEAARDRPREYRLGAICALGMLGSDAGEALPVLEAAMGEDDALIRRFAAEAIKKIKAAQEKE